MTLEGTITGFRQYRTLDEGTVQISCPISGAKITIEANVMFCRKLVEHFTRSINREDSAACADDAGCRQGKLACSRADIDHCLAFRESEFAQDLLRGKDLLPFLKLL